MIYHDIQMSKFDIVVVCLCAKELEYKFHHVL